MSLIAELGDMGCGDEDDGFLVTHSFLGKRVCTHLFEPCFASNWASMRSNLDPDALLDDEGAYFGFLRGGLDSSLLPSYPSSR